MADDGNERVRTRGTGGVGRSPAGLLCNDLWVERATMLVMEDTLAELPNQVQGKEYLGRPPSCGGCVEVVNLPRK